MSADWRRRLLALVLAPVLPLIPIVLYSWSSPYLWVLVLSFGAVAYGLALLFGLPLHLIFNRVGIHEWWAYTAGGGALALLPAIPFALSAGQPLEILALNGLFVAYGACAGWLFWWITKPESTRSDRG